jgi:ribonuclease HII
VLNVSCSPLSSDSKALTAAKRSELFSALKACGKIGYVVHSISAAEISAKMLRK